MLGHSRLRLQLGLVLELNYNYHVKKLLATIGELLVILLFWSAAIFDKLILFFSSSNDSCIVASNVDTYKFFACSIRACIYLNKHYHYQKS